jgi:hypothetical protein
MAWARAAACAALLFGWSVATATGQSADPGRSGSAPAAGADADADMFDRIGRWFDRSVSDFNDGLKDTFTDRQPPPAAPPQRDTSGLAGSPASPLGFDIISQRQKCEPAANGAPDCPRAAEVACRSRGYTTGTSLQTQSERICSLPTLFPQEGPRPRRCRTEAYVLRAICQ